jgi:neutral ceramidase
MSNYTFSLPNGTLLTSCPPAFGYAALAGCTDGAGMKGFSQATVLNPPTNLWSLFFTSVRKPTPETRACHAPKPIVFDAGFAQPYAWAPSVVDIQLMRLGQLVLAISPSEVTTMSGRRWREALLKEAQESIGKGAVTLVAGPANTYAHYVTTPEEYAVQRYEGGSTMFGPNQLAAYINLTVSNLHYLADGSTVLPLQRTMAGDNRKNSWSLFPRVYYDRTPWKRAYGEVLVQPADTYHQGSVISATFQGANPRNNLRLEDTYVAVEKLVNGEWLRVRDDADYFLVYTWRRTSLLLGYSEVDVTWETAPDDEKGVYRLKYFGDAKRMFGHVEAFEGTSASFELL